MSLLGWALAPVRNLLGELRELRIVNKIKLAHLNADIQSGKITGPALDAVTECLEAQSVQLKKKETRNLKSAT